jgi:hypothetical protein
MANDVATVDIVATDEEEAIFAERLTGRTERSIAKRFNVTPRYVREVVRRLAPRIDPESRAEQLSLEFARMERCYQVFYERTLEGDVASASILIRLSERKTSLLALDHAPLRDLTIVNVAPQARISSTHRIKQALDRVVGENPRPELVEVLGPPEPLP